MKLLNSLKDKMKHLLKGGFFHVFVGNMLSKMLSFISSIVIVRLVAKSDYGYLSYADNLYNYAIAFAGMGMSSAILKFCATAKSKQEDKAFYEFALKYGTWFEGILSVVILFYSRVGKIPFPEAKELILLLVLYPVLNNVFNVVQNYLRAHMQNQRFAKMGVVQAVLVFGGSVLFVSIIGINGIVYARYLALAVTIAVGYVFVVKNQRGIKKVALEKWQIKAFLAMSFSLMISNVFSLIMPMNETLLISELIRSEVVIANYKVAVLIPAQLSFISQSIIVYYFSVIAKMTDKEEIWKLSKKIGVFTTAIIGFIMIVGVILTPFIIKIVYGERYSDAAALSTVFWIVYAINASLRMVPMNLLPAVGVAKFNAIVSIASCVIHFVIDYVMIKMWGIWGAGIAIGVVYLLSAIAYWGYLRHVCMKK